jgi:hypothetical protein
MRLAALAVPAALSAGASAAEPAADLHACALIAADTARLACYDGLAGREAPAPHAEAAPARAADVPAAPAPAPVPAAPIAATSALSAPAAAPPARSFGLYPAEHPQPPPVAKSMVARIVELGTSAGGHMTVTLEGGQLWQLEDADPLLAAGDNVTITRATFDSFLMQTPSKRHHRVRRLH